MTKSGRVNLSLGCGRREEAGYKGLDSFDYGHNVVWSAPEKIPYEDDSVDFIKAHNFFEHLAAEDIITTLNECWRIVKKNGSIEIEVPNVHHTSNAFSDITHKSYWTTGTFMNLTCERPRNANYGLKCWNRLHIEVRPDKKAIKAVLTPRKDEN